MLRRISILAVLLVLLAGPAFAQFSGGGAGGGAAITSGTAFPGSPAVGDIIVITDDSVAGACDSAAGSAITLCRWNGSAWLKLGDGTGAGGSVATTDIDTSAELRAIVTDETGTGALVFAGGALGTPSSVTLTNGTGLPISTGVSGLGTGVATFLATPSTANLAAAVTGETGTGAVVFGTSPTIATPTITTSMNFPYATAFPGAPATGDTVIITDDSAAGACDSAAGSAVSLCRWTGAAWAALTSGGGGGSISGSTGATDNAIIRANGTGGSTIQASGCTISDANLLTCPGGFSAGSGTTGYIALLEGTAAGAGTNAGEHNLYFNSTNSLLQSHENGGSVVTYHSTANLPASLAANGANCSSGQFPLGVNASGASESCTALPTSIAGTANEIAASAATGAVTLSLPSTLNLSSKTVRIPNSTTLPATCTVGDMYQDTDATTGLRFYLCEATNSWVAQGSGGGTGLTSLASQTGNVQTITRGTGIGGSSATNDHSFTVDATELHALTWGDGTTSASWTWTYNLNAGTDPVITFNNGVVNVSTGALQEAGNDVFTTGSGEINAVTAKTTPTTSDLLLIEDAAASNAKKKSTVGEVLAAGDARTATLTNKTLDAEATGNVLTIPRRYWFPAAGCNNATAGSVWDLPTSNAAVAACVTGTNTQKGVLDFADGSNLSAQVTHKLPSTWTGAIDAHIKWFSSTTTGDVVWQVATVCVADAETDDPAFNTASTVTDTTKGTTNQTNDATITNVTATGCAAGELLHVKIFRDSAHASDTMAGTARLIGVELVLREAL